METACSSLDCCCWSVHRKVEIVPAAAADDDDDEDEDDVPPGVGVKGAGGVQFSMLADDQDEQELRVLLPHLPLLLLLPMTTTELSVDVRLSFTSLISTERSSSSASSVVPRATRPSLEDGVVFRLASERRPCSNSHSCPMKLRLGEMMDRLVLTNLYASAMAMGYRFMR